MTTSTAVAKKSYGAGVINRRRRPTREQLEHRRASLVEIARDAAPASVRNIYYRAVVKHLVTKDDAGYQKVQRDVLELRRSGRLPWSWVVDPGRSAYSLQTHESPQAALSWLSQTYRRNPWPEWGPRVEVWCESESLAGALKSLSHEYVVDVYPCGGQSSDTFARSAAIEYEPDSRVIILYAGDYDPHGLQIASQLEGKLRVFADPSVNIEFRKLAVTDEQAALPEVQSVGTVPKQRQWKDYDKQRHEFVGLSIEAEAIDHRTIHQMFAYEIEQIAMALGEGDIFDAMREQEQAERDQLREVAARWSL